MFLGAGRVFFSRWSAWRPDCRVGWAGVRAFLADDDPHALGPGRQVEHPGELGGPRAVADLAVGVVGDLPPVFGQGEDRFADVVGEVESDRVLQRRAATQLRNS
jgi:hypothetical protein